MTNEAEDAVERLTEVMNDAIADHEDDVARAREDGERPDLWDAPDVTVSIPDLRRVLAALRAQAERVRVLEGERDELLDRVEELERDAEIVSAEFEKDLWVEVRALLERVGFDDFSEGVTAADAGEILREALRHREARAEAAERRAGELEGALRWYGEQAANCRKITSDGDTARRALDRDGGAKARSLLPATQAEGEK